VVAYMLPQNSAMRALCQKQGFTLRKEEDMLKAELDL
jgi:RimJ/RimL family protein N-acetyltransferase